LAGRWRPGVIEDLAANGQRFNFTHTIVRETLHEELPPARRIALHRRVGEVLECLHAADPTPHLPELAHHFFEAAFADGDTAKAVDYARRAGDAARRFLAYEAAARLYERGLQALELKTGEDPGLRGELLLALAEARHAAGDHDVAKVAC
jgi:predicted ATPase